MGPSIFLGNLIANRSHPAAPLARSLPDVPTLKELGVEMLTGSWFGLLAPKGRPMASVQKLSAAVVKALDDPQVSARLVAQGAKPE